MKLYLVPNWFDVEPLCNDDVQYHDKRKLVVDYKSYEEAVKANKKPTLEDIEHIASEMCQQDWNDLRFQEVYRKAFIEGAKWFNT